MNTVKIHINLESQPDVAKQITLSLNERDLRGFLFQLAGWVPGAGEDFVEETLTPLDLTGAKVRVAGREYPLGKKR